jgi:hypothetical protein
MLTRRPISSPTSRRWLLVALHLFLGVTALAGAAGLISGVLVSEAWHLEETVFRGGTIPGLGLLVVAACALTAAYLVTRWRPFAAPVSLAAGAGIVIFEAVEVTVVQYHWLQALYAGVGLLILGLTWAAPRGDERAGIDEGRG